MSKNPDIQRLPLIGWGTKRLVYPVLVPLLPMRGGGEWLVTDQHYPETGIRFIQRLTRNAYRILGLPGNATQRMILESAKSFQRNLDAGIDRVTPWDLPWLNKVDRTKMDIKDAGGRLSNPSQRLLERLFWFHEGESIVNHLSVDSLLSAAVGWSSAPRPTAGHDAALLHLVAVVLLDPEARDEDQWLATFREWKRVMDSDDYWSEILEAEENGEFELRATDEEIQMVRKEAWRLVADILAGIARDAEARNDLAVCHRVLKVLRKAGVTYLPRKLVADLEEEILGPQEDKFEALCTEIQRGCSDGIERTDEAAEQNRLVCQTASERFDQEVVPRLMELLRLAGSKSDVGLRLRETAAECLRDIAIDWTWADDFIQAETILQKAAEIAAETRVALQIEEKLKQISQQAEEQRRFEAALERFSGRATTSGTADEDEDFDNGNLFEDGDEVEDEEGVTLTRKAHEEGVPHVRPWVRYLARLIDLSIGGIVIGFLGAVVAPKTLELSNVIYSMLTLFIWVFLEASLLSTWGTTPGKWLLRTTVHDSSGHKPIFSAALIRSLTVWWKGCGAGVPIVSFGTMLAGYDRLKNEGITSWDRDGGFVVSHGRIGVFRGISTAGVVAGLLLLATWSLNDSSTSVQPPKTSSTSVAKDGAQPVSRPDDQQSLSALELQIDSGRARIKNLETKLQSIQAEIESMKSQLDEYQSEIDRWERAYRLGGKIDEIAYRRAIREHNALVESYNEKIAEHDRIFVDYEPVAQPRPGIGTLDIEYHPET